MISGLTLALHDIVDKIARKTKNNLKISVNKNRDAIIEEAMKDDMSHAWLLVAGPLLDRGYDHPPLADTVSAYVKLMSILSLVSVLLLFGSGE